MADDDLFTDDVLERPASWGVMLRRGFMKHCPRCGGGHLYRGWFRMHDRCPRCGMRFEREEGFFVGAYLINFAIVEIALFVVLMGFDRRAVAGRRRRPQVSRSSSCAALAVLGPLVTYPWSRTIWSAISLAMHPLELDEIVSARDHLDARPASPRRTRRLAARRDAPDRRRFPPARARVPRPGAPRRGRAARGPTSGPTRAAGEQPSWSEAPPPPDTAPSWASPLERAKAEVAEERDVTPEVRVVDDTAVSDDDESLDDLTDVGVPVVERILGGTVISEDAQ